MTERAGDACVGAIVLAIVRRIIKSGRVEVNALRMRRRRRSVALDTISTCLNL
jgi:hypothetical protein